MRNIINIIGFYLIVFFAVLFFCFIIYFFLLNSFGKSSNYEGYFLEKNGRLTILNFNVELKGFVKPIEVRAVVSREMRFRVNDGVLEYFPNINKEILNQKIFWVRESNLPNEKNLPYSWVGVFRAFDGDFGYIQNRLRSYRVYRKHLDKFEIDYVFSDENLGRDKLNGQIEDIDEKVFEIIKKSGVFEK